MKIGGQQRTPDRPLAAPWSFEATIAQHRLAGALNGNVQMAKALCESIQQIGNDAQALTLNKLSVEQIAGLRDMGRPGWRALHDFANASRNGRLEAVVLGAGITVDDALADGLAELSSLVNLTLPPGPPVADALLLRLRRFNNVQVTQAVDAPVHIRQSVEDHPLADVAITVAMVPPLHIQKCEVGRRVFADALTHDDDPELAALMSPTMNWLLDEASGIAPSHVDRLLVGFLSEAIRLGREELVDRHVAALLDSPAPAGDPGRRFTLLMGRTLPIAPAAWKPEGASHARDAFPIENAAAASLAAAGAGDMRPYRGPTMLHRLAKSTVRPEEQGAMYLGTRALFSSVLRSQALTIPDLRSFCASSFPRSSGGMRTAVELAMERGNLGMVVGMVEAIIYADLPANLGSELLSISRVNLSEAVACLHAVQHLPGQNWAADVLSWMAPLNTSQILTSGDGLVSLITNDSELADLCAVADLRAVGVMMDPYGDGHRMLCRATESIPGLQQIARPGEAPTHLPDAHWYSIPIDLLQIREKAVPAPEQKLPG